jgi:hypothetical protein
MLGQIGMLLEGISVMQGGVHILQLLVIQGRICLLLERSLLMNLPWDLLVLMEHNPKIISENETNTSKSDLFLHILQCLLETSYF